MTATLPPLDLHAHIKTTIPARALEALGAVVFVATRSLDEFATTVQRRDAVTVWGVGSHPGVTAAHESFSRDRFVSLISDTAFVSEVGLDGRSKVPVATQEDTFRSILSVVSQQPRIVSIHSSGATGRVLDALEETPIRGAVLHWWRGTAAQTARAVELGCWFSVNRAGTAHPEDVRHIPLERLLTETDHPSGDKGTLGFRQPGAVDQVERSLATIYGLSADEIRSQMWTNFSRLVEETGVESLLPSPVRRMIMASRRDQ